MKKIFLILFLIFSLVAKPVKIKFATLAPKTSSQGRYLSKIAKELYRATDKNVMLKIYYGGKKGDETEMSEKIQYKDLHGGAFTGLGLGKICSEVRVLELPGLFLNSEEVDYVYPIIEEELNKYFKKKGFVLLSLAETGFAYFFSKEDIKSIASVRKTKMWIWKGDTLVEAFMKKLRIPAKPVNFTEVIPSLQTGLINGFYITPAPAIQLQWYNEVKYMLDVPLVDVTGGLVLSLDKWNELSTKEQDLLKEIVRKNIKALTIQNRIDNQNSINVFKSSGIKINTVEDSFTLMYNTGLDLSKKLSGKLFPRSLVAKVYGLIIDYRKKH